MKNKKTKIAIIGIIALVLVTIGITYAYWLITRTQTGENVITAGCLDITLNGSGDITLSNQFPMSDEDGMNLTPYIFTITNNCNTSVDYQVNLEAMGEESTALSSNALKVELNGSAGLFGSYAEVEPTLSDAYVAYRLKFGTLTAKGEEGSSETYELRLWIDKDAAIEEMNKTFRSKITVTIGQGIFNPYKEGTLAYDILSNYGGADAVTTLGYKFTDGTPATETYSSVSTSANYWYGTKYKLNEETGKYTLSGELVQATLAECRAGQKSDGTTITCGEYTLMNEDKTHSNIFIRKITSFTNTEKSDTSSYLYMTTQIIYSVNGFSGGTTSSDAGIYKAPDDLGTSYYFRGNVTNNYVKFGKDSEGTTVETYQARIWDDVNQTYIVWDTIYDSPEECNAAISSYNGFCDPVGSKTVYNDMYWRIVRINGDGSIRLIYDGPKKVANGTEHTAEVASVDFNTYSYDVPGDAYNYASYTYDNESGTQVNSNANTAVDNWYKKNLKTKYGKYIEENAIFCNDREMSQAEDGRTIFAPYVRLEREYTGKMNPVLTCTNQKDRYSMDSTIGNGLLTSPVGLITADEFVMAGANNSSVGDAVHYLDGVRFYWTMSPAIYGGSEIPVYFVYDESELYDYGMSSYGIRPVINLKADVEFINDGSFETPYEIVMD